MSEHRTIRWGILGTARIATKVARAIAATDGAEVVAVASRSAQRAASWAAEHGVPASYGSYHDMLADQPLDAIYIPLPPSMHAEWTIRCAESGRHVLCEKPIAASAAQADEMAAACREHGVQLMDGTMWVHHPRSAEMLRRIQDGTLGDLRRVTAALGLALEPYLRRKPPHMAGDPADGALPLERLVAAEYRLQPALGGGALLDTGWYGVRAAVWAFGDLPQQVFATARYRHGVDTNLSALMWYDRERMASFDCGFDLAARKWLEVVGTDGSLTCDDFLNPRDPARPEFQVRDASGEATASTAAPRLQEQCMIDEFCRIVRSGALVSDWPNAAIATQRVCDALGESARSGKVVEL